MSNTPRAMVSGSLKQYGDRAIADALEGAFINADLARRIEELQCKANMWDMHMEVKRLKVQKRLDSIQKRNAAKKNRRGFWGMFNLRKIR